MARPMPLDRTISSHSAAAEVETPHMYSMGEAITTHRPGQDRWAGVLSAGGGWDLDRLPHACDKAKNKAVRTDSVARYAVAL